MGNKGGQTTTQTQIQEVPDWSLPYYTDILGKSKALSEETYTPYGGQRIVRDSADLGASQDMLRGIVGQPIEGFEQARSAMSSLGQQAAELGQFDPAQFSAYGFDPTRQFDSAEMHTYMSPYMQAVVQRQQEDAYEQFGRMQAGRDASAVQAGAFGGSRRFVQQGIAEEALARQLGDIQATGSQQAFEQAQMQFERDRAAQMQTEEQRAAEEARVQTSTAEDAARSRALKLQAMGFSADMARDIANLGERARAGDIQAAQLLEAQGLGAMARDQAGLDMAYQDFLRQQAYPAQQLGTYSNILNRLPVGDAGTTTTMEPYNPMQEALGAGISLIGLRNAGLSS